MRNTMLTTTIALLLAAPITGCNQSQSPITQASADQTSGDVSDCTLTQGYWKNHPDAWPVDSLMLGSVTYTKAQLIAIFETPVAGNGLISLAHQLIAAKLNVAKGADDTDIASSIAAADAMIGSLVVPPVGSGYLAPSAVSSLVGALDDFNSSSEDMCASHPTCGNGVVETGEQCDDGNTTSGDGCSATCTKESSPRCGDGHVDTGEQCDDGNTTSGDGCSATCTLEASPRCGDHHVDAGEQCDDGNTTSGDGCSATCTLETSPRCGDHHVDAGEQCDDGNTTSGDGCSATCTLESSPRCGDGHLDAGEQCDDGNTTNGDGCSSTCVCEP